MVKCNLFCRDAIYTECKDIYVMINMGVLCGFRQNGNAYDNDVALQIATILLCRPYEKMKIAELRQGCDLVWTTQEYSCYKVRLDVRVYRYT